MKKANYDDDWQPSFNNWIKKLYPTLFIPTFYTNHPCLNTTDPTSSKHISKVQLRGIKRNSSPDYYITIIIKSINKKTFPIFRVKRKCHWVTKKGKAFIIWFNNSLFNHNYSAPCLSIYIHLSHIHVIYSCCMCLEQIGKIYKIFFQIKLNYIIPSLDSFLFFFVISTSNLTTKAFSVNLFLSLIFIENLFQQVFMKYRVLFFEMIEFNNNF